VLSFLSYLVFIPFHHLAHHPQLLIIFITQTELWQRLFFPLARKREGFFEFGSSFSSSFEMEQRDSSRSELLSSRGKAQRWKVYRFTVGGPSVKQRAMEEAILRRERASSRCQERWREHRRRSASSILARLPLRRCSPSKKKKCRDLWQILSSSGFHIKFFPPLVLSRVFLNSGGKINKLGSSSRGCRKETSKKGISG